MDFARKLAALDKQIADANDGQPDDLERWVATTEVVIRKVMGAGSRQHEEFLHTDYRSKIHSPDLETDPAVHRVAGVRHAIAILESAKQELELGAELEGGVVTLKSDEERVPISAQGPVFIVHGHDGEAKHQLARLLRDLTGVDPIILHERPNAGRTIIEKFEELASSASFAVALLTADDLGREKNAETDRPRARQNVVLEAGYFAGHLGRARVVLLYEDGVELPGDFDGLLYVPLDPGGAWKTDVAREMQAQGMNVDWNAAFGVR